MATSPSALGANLRAARDAAGLSRAALAEASGTSEPSIARTELYGSKPRLNTLEAWATVLGIGVGDLVDDPGEFAEPSPEERVARALARGACVNCTTPTRQVWHNGEICPEEPAVAS